MFISNNVDLPFTPTLTNFATERTKETGPTEKFLEKY